MSAKILYSSGSDSEDGDGGFHINEQYADRYDNWREKEEIEKLKARYGDDATSVLAGKLDAGSSSSSESEDDDAEAITPQIERDFLKTLSLLKSKDPKIYDKDAKFYESDDDAAPSDGRNPRRDRRREKPMYIRDYNRHIILDKQGQLSEEESSDDADDHLIERPRSPTFVQEQRQLKESFKNVVASDSDSDGGEGDLLRVREKTREQLRQEEDEYRQWLRGQTAEISDAKAGVELSGLRDYWNRPDLDDGETFLKDYILGKGYLDVAEHGDGGAPTYEEIVADEPDLSEDEADVERQEQFEHRYNFRFEEPDGDLIHSYPRAPRDTLRRHDTARADRRHERRDRKARERERHLEALKTLKNAKRREILRKVARIRAVAGDDGVAVDEDELEADFDAARHDAMMHRMFGDDADGDGDDDEAKPVFLPDDDDNDEYAYEENWDEWVGGGGDDDDERGAADKETTNAEPTEGAPGPSSSSWQEEVSEHMRGGRTRRRETALACALRRRKPTFDPRATTFQAYFDEYYSLDCEDMIGDMPCRFKYREVPANDFGLTLDEILRAKDKELNAWASLKKAVQYRGAEEEAYEAQAFRKKALNVAKKRRLLPSVYAEEGEEGAAKKKRRRRRKKKSNVEEVVASPAAGQAETLSGAAEEVGGKATGKASGEATKRCAETNRVAGKQEQGDGKKGKKKKVQSTKDKKKKVQGKEKKKKQQVQSEECKQKKQVQVKDHKEETEYKEHKKKRKLVSDAGDDALHPKKVKKIKNSQKPTGGKRSKDQITADRLKAYGINPKKFKSKKLSVQS
ncbi:PREDICTED: protein KRI1 homolog [Priapulus caudatus]|uniref:Protein KRI1 homolog n=1 Tax=Priapulus caudatus TaxID=37621 RepID=A0ABM1E9K6_PRICU|nr:PREDICTED: protein KRI1 homolog [Priapulus caudatus]